MAGQPPSRIWRDAIEEGERRLHRQPAGLASTGLVGGTDVMFGILALVVLTGALQEVLPEQLSHVIGSLAFGIAFVFIAVGRSELFTENFLVPVAALLGRRGRFSHLVRLWTITLVFNLVALAALAWIFQVSGVLHATAIEAAGDLADNFVDRDMGAAFLSAVIAGTVMTLFTWFTVAVGDDAARVALALIVGFLLAAPSLNHAVVSFGEIGLGVISGTSEATVGQWFGNLGIAIAGNMVGGMGFVFLTRLFQVRGEVGEEHPERGSRMDGDDRDRTPSEELTGVRA